MAADYRALLDALDDLIRAYRARIVELEAIVANQQSQLDLKPQETAQEVVGVNNS